MIPSAKRLGLVALALALLAFLTAAPHLSEAQTVAASAAEAPLLRIEPGAHTAPIRALSVDAEGRYALTAAEDKTARLWDLASGRQLQVLRPPIGEGNEGRLFAGALSPDARLAAVGGWSRDNEVWLFERGSGRLVHRIAGLPNVVTHLAFSPDGRRLLVSLWGRHGIRLFASDDGWQSSREAGADREYGGESYGADISADGSRVVTAAFDGLVRLYALGAPGRAGEPALRLLASARAPGGQRPFAVALAPDGKRVAVGFADSPAVSVLDTSASTPPLQPLYAPSTAGIDNGSLSALAWSRDGSTLWAAGSWKRGTAQHGLRRWSEGGRGSATDSTLAANTVVGLRALGDGRLVHASADPAWGVLGANRERLLQGTAGLADFRGARSSFRLAANGAAVAFSTGPEGAEPAAFDLDRMAWSRPAAAWSASPASSAELALEGWFESAQPLLNQRRLALEANEIALAAAVNTAGRQLALGTNFHVRYLDAQGRELWRAVAPGSTWQLACSQDGRWVVAAFSDGSLRWYRARDGAEQLALLPHADRRRWIAWTPQGHYAASAGGEELIGWHLNRGPLRAADFYAASRFRAGFFRPEVVSRVLSLGDVQAALKAAEAEAGRSTATAAAGARIEQQLPPVVAILSPGDGTSTRSAEVRLSVSVRAPADAPATTLRVRVNGQIVQSGAGEALPRMAGAEEIRHELHVPLPAEDAEIMVFAENRHGFSTPAVLRLRRGEAAAAAPVATPTPPVPAAAVPAPTAALDTRPTLYVLAVGVSRYRDAALRLAYPAKDANDFATLFRAQQGLYRQVVVKVLTDEGARRDDVLDGLEWIRREMTARDVGLVFLAGHGVNDNDGAYYFLPQDVQPDRLKRSGVLFTEIRNTLTALPGKVLFFVDTCHSGNVLGTARRGLPNDITAVVNELSSAENGVIVFAASTGRQQAQESPDWGNGAFTKAVLEGAAGRADAARSGRVTHKMLDLYISERVKQLTAGGQSPVTIVPQGVPDFPVAVPR